MSPLSPVSSSDEPQAGDRSPRAVPPPAALRGAIRAPAAAVATVAAARQQLADVLSGRDPRRLAIVGPCSIHDPASALEYAAGLAAIRRGVEDDLLVVMRVYFEKPRTTVGWKGLLHDPRLDGSRDLPAGLRLGRQILADVAALGLPPATELLDPLTPPYLEDLIAWTAIGARTVESQTHRQLASGLPMPVGFKNGTDGTVQTAVDAVLAARAPHGFLGVDDDGRVAMVETAGNPHGHVVLRGGRRGPNHDARSIAKASAALAKAALPARVIVDCSHGNSGKDHRRQPAVAADLAAQIVDGAPIAGVMVESHLVAGRQALDPAPGVRSTLVPGQSVTDACIDLATTRAVLEELARASRQARPGRRLSQPVLRGPGRGPADEAAC